MNIFFRTKISQSQKCRMTHHKNTEWITTKIPNGLPQKYRIVLWFKQKSLIRFMYVGAALSLMAVPSAARPTSWHMPAPHSSRLARSVRISPSSSVRFSKLTSLVVKDSCIRRCQGRKVSLIRSENNR